MRECRHCGEYLYEAEDKRSARCPACREPLFERPGGPSLISEGRHRDRGVCVLHAENAAAGTCKRCGNFYCSVCRTPWEERLLCLTCVEHLLGQEGAIAEGSKIHARQALLGLLCGLGAWACVLFGVLMLGLVTASPSGAGLAGLGAVLIVGSLVPAVLGIGQAATAIRVRGDRMIPATFGLILSGLHVGAFLGLVLALLTVGGMTG